MTEAARQSDLRRDGAVRAHGWEPVRYGGERLRDDPLGVVAELSMALARAERALEDRALAARGRTA